ncbi:UDP-glucose:sterol glycosyltransferase [Talaromyces stipitatus ATCC 10500]|uniref:Sterol 3-beta-glucosyltransferase n=1 Tax=Talaromyces stipitatus (strain ATCC 10500 / CBS 375.48 / QM 6759 / NRRL 1006) TaxID=441959 RepID=B8M704_TALSN|nr:UDP-glucose:sterol glycosyltransferase [Talaromyces stipitatus ATCC 10500]EED20224.1 UDP-glucose:sterol glycosyltransferase [Talaromyces stipitatus ATCC 10500]
MASSDNPEKKRVSHRIRSLSKSLHRLSSNNVPDRLKNNDDEQEDFTAPPKNLSGRDIPYMQQSVFSLIAAAGSRSDFHSRFDESSDSDGDDSEGKKRTEPLHRRFVGKLSQKTGKELSSAQAIPEEAGQDARPSRKPSTSSVNTHRRTGSGNRLIRSIPGLAPKQNDKESKSDQFAIPVQSQQDESHTPAQETKKTTPRTAPVLSRMIEAQTRFDPEALSTEEHTQAEKQTDDKQSDEQKSKVLLPIRLKEIFGFENPEPVIGEYPCWLMQNVALQGYMYITEGHICFYAYLPQKSNVTVKSGQLGKRGRKNPRYKRYWFSLKGDVFSYYADPSKLYFPSGHIDLRYGISASLADREKGKDTRDFTVTTDHRTYYFRADSASSANEWVKALQKVIFRSQNEGGRVKISLPLEDVIDIEESPMMDLAQTFKIRVVDIYETYAIDEHFFSFFNFGQDAYEVLKGLINDTAARRIAQDPAATQVLNQVVGESYRQRADSSASETQKAKIESGSAQKSETSDQHQESDSFVQSMGHGTDSSLSLQSHSETIVTASQILTRDDVFNSPTIHSFHPNTSLDGVSFENPVISPSTEPIKKTGQETPKKPEQDASIERKTYVTSAPTIHELVKAGTYPLQRAAGFAEYLKSRSRQMSNLLATESMGYIEKVSGMWIGGGKHYAEGEDPALEQFMDGEDAETSGSYGDRFRAHFALPPTEKLQATYYGYLHRVLPLYGKIYIGSSKFCFRSLLPGTRTKMILPIKDIENVEKEKGFRFGYQGLVLIIRGHEELFFEFNTADSRDDCAVTLHHRLESVRFLAQSSILAQKDKDEADAAKAEQQLLQEAMQGPLIEDSQEVHPIFDDPRASIVNFKPKESLRITCLTIGSRGDVQPYIGLCKGLLEEGHRPRIATHAEFEPWVRKHGIDFAPVEGDPAELMRICVENGMFTYSFLKEASSKFRGWIDDLLTSAWSACQDSDVLIESPSAMAGIHIAEALRIPYFRAFTMPWSRTRAYPHAFAVPEHKMGGAYNYITYVMFDNVFWRAISGQVNRWRKLELGLRGTTLDKMQANKVPFLYNYSPSVVPPPLDYPDWIRVTGYWFLNEASNWTPPTELTDFIIKAREDGKKIVYIGFGSIVVSDPAALTRTVVESVQKADIRCILSKGWSDRLGDPKSTRSEVPLPAEIHQIQSAPHDWLFTQIDAAVHHGGAGTTGASLRAGVPTIVKPFFGDQFFFGSRIEDLGVGICMKKLNVGVFSRALWEATHSERMILKAKLLGEQIRMENGVANAIQAIYRDLEYARTLTHQRASLSITPHSPATATDENHTAEEGEEPEDMEEEESWTFVDEYADPELLKNENNSSRQKDSTSSPASSPTFAK